jgi:Domain of unknown function (DUF5134)
MGAPAWLTGIFAALMLTVAVYCAGRLIAARRWRRPTEVDTDAGHVLMGVAMAGMLAASLRVVPAVIWEPVFGAGAVWFGSQALRARGGALTSPWRCLHPAPHMVECAAMLYMFLILPTLSARTSRAGMGAMSGSATASRFSFLALILALFMFGYVVRVADRLTVPVRALAFQPAGTASSPPVLIASAANPASVPTAGAANPASVLTDGAGPAGTPASTGCGAASTPRPGRSFLAPRCSALCKLAMGMTMGYMLILML